MYFIGAYSLVSTHCILVRIMAESTAPMSSASELAESTASMSSVSKSERPSLFDRLRSPALSDLCRKRKVDTNRARPLGKKRSSGQALYAAYIPKTVNLAQHAREFPSEYLVEFAGKLFYRACRETLCLKRSVVQNHVKSSKHGEGKKKLEVKQARGISSTSPGKA